MCIVGYWYFGIDYVDGCVVVWCIGCLCGFGGVV